MRKHKLKDKQVEKQTDIKKTDRKTYENTDRLIDRQIIIEREANSTTDI